MYNSIEESYEEDKKNRRRSKNDNYGRNYKCDICYKAYLSYPALYTHIKTKHDSAGKTKGRGRPKKDFIFPGGKEGQERVLYNPLTFDFFKHPERTGTTLSEDLFPIFDFVFNEVYVILKKKNENSISTYESVNDVIFFKKISDFFTSVKDDPNLINTIDENSKCDDILCLYLFKVSKFANPNCFRVIVKFVTLFRECLNTTYTNQTKSASVYTSEFTAEDAPDISNELIINYLHCDTENSFTKNEAIDLTQNLCQWLYDNNFTCSKLSLINNS